MNKFLSEVITEVSKKMGVDLPGKYALKVR